MKCAEKLTAVIEEQKDQSTLTTLTHDTEVARNYLLRSINAQK
jgi:hypothetical protein